MIIAQLYLKQSRAGSILYVTIATWLIQLVRRKTCTSSGTIRLNGVALIEQTLVVELLQQIPQGLDILIVICNIRIVEVHEIAHALCEFTPFSGKLHHILTALLIVVLSRNILLALFIINISLCNTQLFLNA